MKQDAYEECEEWTGVGHRCVLERRPVLQLELCFAYRSLGVDQTSYRKSLRERLQGEIWYLNRVCDRHLGHNRRVEIGFYIISFDRNNQRVSGLLVVVPEVGSLLPPASYWHDRN